MNYYFELIIKIQWKKSSNKVIVTYSINNKYKNIIKMTQHDASHSMNEYIYQRYYSISIYLKNCDDKVITQMNVSIIKTIM